MSNAKYSNLKSILKVRFDVARESDESPQFVIPNNIMFSMLDIAPTSIDEMHLHFKQLSKPVLANIDKFISIFKKPEVEVINLEDDLNLNGNVNESEGMV